MLLFIVFINRMCAWALFIKSPWKELNVEILSSFGKCFHLLLEQS